MRINNAHSVDWVVGIDATNIRGGGGVTHLVELLAAAEPEKHGISKVVVWGGSGTLRKLSERFWLVKVNPPALNQGLLRRMWWQRFHLSRAANAANCSVLFVPGGSYSGNFRPVVAMNQNILPFEWQEIRRYGLSLTAIKFGLLRYIQSLTFRGVDGVIFLSEYARQVVSRRIGHIDGKTTTIPHGLNQRFFIEPRAMRIRREYTNANPCRILYVSIINQYKHQWHVVEAVHTLRAEGLPVVLDLVGPAYAPELARLQNVIARFDPKGSWVNYRGTVPYEIIHTIYEDADIGVFASSCETFGLILLENMAAGLPVACSNRGPMPEILGETGLYFDPEKPADIVQVLNKYILSPKLRQEKAQASYERAKNYSWQRCADETFRFLAQVAGKHRKKHC